jgi:hypothetical protein
LKGNEQTVSCDTTTQIIRTEGGAAGIPLEEQTKPCPYCGATIGAMAVRCTFCDHRVPAPVAIAGRGNVTSFTGRKTIDSEHAPAPYIAVMPFGTKEHPSLSVMPFQEEDSMPLPIGARLLARLVAITQKG